MARKRWIVNQVDKSIANAIAEESNMDPFLALLLSGRGFADPTEMEEFLSDDSPLADPLDFSGMEKAVERIQKAIDGFERIAVYGDYDADGVTSTALLSSYLIRRGANLMYYIPDRSGEGYGMNLPSLQKLHEQGVSLIITVDNGIRSIEETDFAADLDMDIIVTDHHIPGGALPAACAVIDPHISGHAGYQDYAGVGVAFFLICGLEGCSPEELLYEYGDLICIGTVADVMPLTGENRQMVKVGLHRINESPRPGVKALLSCAGLGNKPVSAGNVAFQLAPRLNAAGRIGSPDRAVRLLLEEDTAAADNAARELNEENAGRRELEQRVIMEASAWLSAHPVEAMKPVLVIKGEGWHPGVIGLAASRLAELHGRPTIVMTDDGADCVGSARSVSGVSIYDIITGASHLCTRFGGHKQAAGMTVPSERFPEFVLAIEETARKLYPIMPFPELQLDCKLNPASISTGLTDTLKQLEPFGCGNPTPLFGLFGMKLEGIYPMGGGKHQKLILTRSDCRITALKFGTTAEQLQCQAGDLLDLAVTLDTNEYNGERSVSVIIRDMRLAGQDEEAILADLRRYEAYKTAGLPDAALKPTREEIGLVYRYIRQQKKLETEGDVLAFRVGLPLGKTRIALDVLEEFGLIGQTIKGGRLLLTFLPAAGKVQLDNSRILRELA